MSAYHRNALPRGHELADYTIESILGHGGFGVTYLARDNSLGALVAIKEYLPHELAQRKGQTQVVPDFESRSAVKDYHWGLKRFLQEAQALARFKHAHIVRVLRYMEENGTAYMVMEYEKGQSLGQHLRRHGNKLDETEMLRIFLPILNGLEAVHEAGMLHLDIKPDNIYIREDGSPMLIDFGSARQAMSDHGGRAVLTPGYAPIEQYPDKGKQGPWTDIYAIGASMYRCIQGKRPVDSIERYQMILKYHADPMTPAEKIGKGLYQKRLLQCIDWALQSYPTDRPKSAREFQDTILSRAPLEIKPALQAEIKGIPVKRHEHADREKWPRLIGKFAWVIPVVVAVAAIAYFWPEIKAKWPEYKPMLLGAWDKTRVFLADMKNLIVDLWRRYT